MIRCDAETGARLRDRNYRPTGNVELLLCRNAFAGKYVYNNNYDIIAQKTAFVSAHDEPLWRFGCTYYTQ